MDKQVIFRGQSEQGVFCRPLFSSMDKTAAVGADWDLGGDIRKVISGISAQQRKENAYVLVNALGAGEFFGSNINADHFPWNALAHEGDDYGYKTFLNAHCFTHHANKDPNHAIGKPIWSGLNTRMKRVELIIEVNREKARLEGADGIITRVDAGEFPDVSMGARVPYDRCSICDFKSKTREEYCEHMRPSPELRGIYGPNKILPDGRRIFVYNDYPRFFDISFVFIGADKTAKVMTKLAQKGNQVCLGPVCTIEKTSSSVYKNQLGSRDGVKIWVVDGPKVRESMEPDFTMGGNHGRYKFIPKDEIWIDSSLASDEIKYTIDHELKERSLMFKGMKYDPAHEEALKLEHSEREADKHKTACMHFEEDGLHGPCGGLCSACSKQASCHMDKLASAFTVKTSAHRKLSEIIKEIPTGAFAMKKLPALESSEPTLPKDTLDALSNKPLEQVLSGVTGLGMVLKPAEFQRITLMRMGEEDLADILDDDNKVFKSGLSPSFAPVSRDMGPHAHSLLPLLRGILGDRTAFGPSLKIRIMVIKNHNPIPTPKEIDHPLLNKIGAAYSAYRRSSLEKIAQAAQVVESDCLLREAVLGENLVSMFKTATDTRIVDLDSVTYLMGAYLKDRGLNNAAVLSEKIAVANPGLLSEPMAKGI